MANINKRLRFLADKHYGGSIKAMAVDLGIKPSTLTDLVAGVSNPSYDTICKILKSERLKVEANWLLFGESRRDIYLRIIEEQQKTINKLLSE